MANYCIALSNGLETYTTNRAEAEALAQTMDTEETP